MEGSNITQEDITHTFLLLGHIELLRSTELQLNKIAFTYRHLLSCKAKQVLEAIPLNADALAIARAVNKAVHNGCNGGKLCPYNEKHEEDVLTMVTTALDSEVYRECIYERVAIGGSTPDVSCLDRRKTNAIRKRRQDAAQQLYRSHIPRAVWKHALGYSSTPLEAILLDGSSLADLYVNCNEALALLERVTKSVGMLDDPTVCRTCGVRQKRGKPAFHLTCDDCGRVWFCSKFCKQDKDKGVLAHLNECDLLL